MVLSARQFDTFVLFVMSLAELMEKIEYSEKFSDFEYEYRYVGAAWRRCVVVFRKLTSVVGLI